ncbi:efflux RND transporter periplasmic adaptor subunit [Brucepastera parasyntrophica]|uniref:efflux RND transporter periplasmic adaptor subunit n=1 Tax=Brucepastera parasyntrophica TaxID=2880008 RepID=UPI00210A1C3B|nr:efflux RND transporter periplasmic adaptor subunit [Brucepastera parasyntrophica]ULQ59069.1 efflux RND transporter periplasmic adaptor subunit [Brucepastera parasyntrophica]
MHSKLVQKIGIVAAGLMLCGLPFISCSRGGASGNADAQEQEPQIIYAVATTTATKGELNDYLEFGGDVAAKTSIDALPDATGRIMEVRVRVGDTVVKDQVLALVDASRPGMNYEPSPVKAPISGTVTAVNVVPGSMVSQQSSVAKIGKMETLEITMNVPERYVSKIKLGQMAYLRFDAYPGDVFPAKITEVSPVLDQSARTMSVKLSLIEKDDRIKAGMFARVKLITDTKSNTVKIPDSAVVSRFGETFVFVVEDNAGKTIVKRHPVKVGLKVDDKVEILSGLQPGDEIIIRGQTLLEDGSVVNIVSRTAPLPEMETI